MWGPPDDPQIYGAMEVDATPLRAIIDAAKAAGHRVTPTHLVGRAVATALHEVPDFNVRVRGNRMYPRAPSTSSTSPPWRAGGRCRA